MAEHVAGEVHGAALPGAAQHLRDRRLQSGVRVGDAQPDAGQAAGPQAAQKLPPEHFGLALADIEAEHLAPAGLVDGVGEHQALLPHAAGLADPLDLRVEPQIGVGALQGALAERRDLLVQAATQPADLVLAHAPQPHLLDEPIDPAGAHAVDIGLLNHGDEGLLRALARLQE